MPPSASSHDATGSGSSSASQRGVQNAQSSNSNSDSTSQQAGVAHLSAPRTEHELSQAFKDLARGEQTATALEAHLTSLETKLDELLDSFMSAAGAVPPATDSMENSAGGNEADGARGQDGQGTTGK